MKSTKETKKQCQELLHYDDFKMKVLDNFMDFMSDEYKDMELRCYEVDKINVVKDAICLVGKGFNVSPTLYMDDMYRQYLYNGNFYETLKGFSNSMKNAMKMKVEFEPKVDFVKKDSKNNIVFQLINTEQNKKLLEKVPHREFLDLSIVYRMMVDENEESIASAMINNDLLNMLGLTENELFELAKENTKRIMNVTVKSLFDVILNAPYDIIDDIEEIKMDIPEENPFMMWVITNNKNINGAISMVYEDVLYELAEKLKSDLYIIPSSIHEVIAIPTGSMEPYSIAEMVAMINMSEVRLEERLSNQVYYYDKELRKISLATNTQNIRLDTILC